MTGDHLTNQELLGLLRECLPLAESAAKIEESWNAIGTTPIYAARDRFKRIKEALK